MYRPPELHFTPYPDERCDQFKLTEAYTFYGTDGQRWVIPAGFVTDFASVPRLLWPLIPSMGAYWYAALVHDWLYINRVGMADFGPHAKFSPRAARLLADLEFYRLMVQAAPFSSFRNWLMFQAVRWFGPSWDF